MNALQAIKEALESLGSNKMRSGLTILGIVIGVAAVIAMLSIGRGASSTITESLESIGTTNLYVSTYRDENVRNPEALTIDDAEALIDPYAGPSIAAAAPLLSGTVYATVGGEAESVSFTGTTPSYQEINGDTLSEGTYITQEEVDARSSVVVIGQDTADTLFGRTFGLVGETIRINGTPYKIVGVLDAQGGSSSGSSDDRIIVPITTAQTRLSRRGSRNQVDSITVQAIDAESVSDAEAQIYDIIADRHETEEGYEDIQVMTVADMVESATSIIDVLTYFLGGVAGISLLVGGIGIMNIMLVSVTERTREIGLRKALGARRFDILFQFLTESALLSLAGGVVGVLLGYGISQIIAYVAASAGTSLTPVLGADMVILATGFSTAIGLFFGLYPANRAASLQPVVALRHE